MASGALAGNHPDASNHSERIALYFQFQQNTGNLASIREYVIRPFDGECDTGRKRLASLANRKASDEAECGSNRRRHRFREQQAHRKIARRRNPFAASAAATCRLFVCDDPDRSVLACAQQAQRLAVGRIQSIMLDDAVPAVAARGPTANVIWLK